MNKIYRVVWNESTQTAVAVMETAASHSPRGSTLCAGSPPPGAALACRLKRLVLALALALGGAAPALAGPPAPTQLPTGAQVVAGQATVTQPGPATLQINQSSQAAVINWQSFNLGSAASVHFAQPSATSSTLNRVLDSNPSQIYGRITAPGQVFFTNPAGMYFGPGSSVDVGGLVATTHSISDADFMAGNYQFARNGARGSIVNAGELKASLGGYIALLAPEVRNQGVVVAQMGTVALAAGDLVTLQMLGTQLSQVTVSPATIQTLVDNASAVLAPGGLIILSAQAADQVQGSVVNNSGTLAATGLALRNGRVVLDAGAQGSVSVSGGVQTASADGAGGDITVTGRDIVLQSGSTLDASGASGGGNVRVGGDWQGSGNLQQATTVRMEAGAVVDASATGQGDGGKVVLWSDIHNSTGQTTAAGSILARGGAQGGNGGRVETSGYHLLADDARVNAGATAGSAGQWLLDPFNYTINSASNINIALSSTSVTIDTAASAATGAPEFGSSGVGNITLNSAISKTSGGATTLTMLAANNIALNANITSTSGALNLLFKTAAGDITTTGTRSIASNGGAITFWTDSNNAASPGAINFGGTTSITSLGGNITLGGGAGTTAPTGYALGSATNSTGVNAGASSGIPVTVDAGGGNITIRGQGAAGASANGVSFNNGSALQTVGAGTITVDGISGTGSTWSIGTVLDRSTISAVDGDITITGKAMGTTPSQSLGLTQQVSGSVGASGSGNVSLSGISGVAGATGILANSNTFGNSTGTGTLTLAADAFDVTTSTMSGNEALVLQPASTSFAGASFSAPLSGAALTVPATIRSLTVGSATNATPIAVGTLSVAGPINLLAPGTGGTVTLNGDLTSTLANAAITVTTGSTTTLGANAIVTTSNGAVNLGNVNASSAGGQSLTVNSGSGITSLGVVGGTAALSSLAVTSGPLSLANNVTTTGAQQYTTAGDITVGNANIGSSGGAIGFTATGGAISTSSSSTINTGGGLLTLNAANTSVLSGVVSGSGGLTDAGVGKIALAGGNLYTGTTTVSAGSTLQIGNGGTSGSITSNITNNGTLIYNRSDATTLTNSVGNAGSGTTVFAGSGKVTVTNSGVITGPSAVVTIISGSGSLVQGSTTAGAANASAGTTILTGTNSYGATTISGGTLQIGNGGATGSLGSGNVVDNTALVLNRTGSLTVAGAISGTGSLTQAGSGTTILAANNSYAGATTISAGTLQLGNGGTTGSLGSAATVTDNGTLAFNRSDTVTLTPAISGSGNLTQAGSGTTVLTAANTYAGTTTISAGTLQIGNGGSSGSLGGGAVSDQGALVFNRSDNITVSNTISGAGSVTQAGAGTLTFDNTLPLTGALNVNAGSMTLSTPNWLTLNASSVNINNGSTVNVFGASGALRYDIGTTWNFDANGGNTLNVNNTNLTFTNGDNHFVTHGGASNTINISGTWGILNTAAPSRTAYFDVAPGTGSSGLVLMGNNNGLMNPGSVVKTGAGKLVFAADT